jgi:hypothetical protein
MYLNLNHINDFADEYRVLTLRKKLKERVQRCQSRADQYRDVSERRRYCELILKQVDTFSLEYFQSLDPEEAERNPLSLTFLSTITADIAHGKTGRTRSHQSPLEDRVRVWLREREDIFQALEIASFVTSVVERRRNERSAGLTKTSIRNYEELLKIENEAREQYENGVYFLKLLGSVAENYAQYARGNALAAEKRRCEAAQEAQGAENKIKDAARDGLLDEEVRYRIAKKAHEAAMITHELEKKKGDAIAQSWSTILAGIYQARDQLGCQLSEARSKCMRLGTELMNLKAERDQCLQQRLLIP